MSDDPASAEHEPLAERLSGLVAERQRDIYPSGVMIGLRSVQRIHVSAGRFGPSWSPRLVLAKWVLQGSGAMQVDDQRLVFGPGQVAIYLPTIPHRFWAMAARNRFSRTPEPAACAPERDRRGCISRCIMDWDFNTV